MTKIDARTGAPENVAKREVVITRVFEAPREFVFKAWTDPKHMARWWGPMGFTNPICELDARVGGAWRIVMRSPAGIEYPCGGVYREMVDPERLVFTNIATDNEGNPVLDGLTAVIFAEHGGKTKLTLQTRAVAVVAHAAAHLEGMEAGWTQSLERLAEELARS
ncbi:MAG: SRPBCC domain-containing protein [Pseudomonadota bacterium]|nr:SRPBCC domain-containing protein [Pseudomonadota bacterium]